MLVFGDTDGGKSPPDTSSPDDAGIATVHPVREPRLADHPIR
jgi:hypothetical protein